MRDGTISGVPKDIDKLRLLTKSVSRLDQMFVFKL